MCHYTLYKTACVTLWKTHIQSSYYKDIIYINFAIISSKPIRSNILSTYLVEVKS